MDGWRYMYFVLNMIPGMDGDGSSTWVWGLAFCGGESTEFNRVVGSLALVLVVLPISY